MAQGLNFLFWREQLITFKSQFTSCFEGRYLLKLCVLKSSSMLLVDISSKGEFGCHGFGSFKESIIEPKQNCGVAL